MSKIARFWRVLRAAHTEWNQDRARLLGAGLAYFAVFAIAPVLLLLIRIAGTFFGESETRQAMETQIELLAGPSVAQASMDVLNRARAAPGEGTFATLSGIALLLYASTRFFAQLQGALNTIWEVPRVKSGWRSTVRKRTIGFVMVLGSGLFLLVSVLLGAVLSALGSKASELLPGSVPLLRLLDPTLTLIIGTLLFALIYRYLPDRRVEWSDVWAGAVTASVLFLAGKFLLSMILSRSAFGSPYGIAGSVAVLLVWLYFSAQVTLFGAELTRVYARREGSARGETDADDVSKRTDDTRE